MYPAVISVSALPDFHLRLVFSNGEIRRFDMNPFMHLGIFRELQKPELFQTVQVSFDTIRWINDADIDPETLYEGGVPVGEV
jgi:hypothetical protein